MTAYRDYEIERRVNDLRRLQSAVTHFDRAVMQGMVAMKDIASAYEAVGQALTELTLNNNNPVPEFGAADEPNPFPTEADVQYMAQQAAAPDESGTAERPHRDSHATEGAASVASTRMPDETNSQVRQLAKIFAEEVRRINEGPPFQTYNTGIHRDVITRMLPVTEHLKSIGEYRHTLMDGLNRYNKYKAEVEKVERKYTKKGKPFCDSRTHKKATEKRDESWKEFVKRREKFNHIFGLLMEVNDHAAAQIIHRYLSLNHEYLQQLVVSMERVLPAIAEVYPLNNEYNSVQNMLILEAVANAKTPFADHSKTHRESATPGEGGGPGVDGEAVEEPRPDAEREGEEAEGGAHSSLTSASSVEEESTSTPRKGESAGDAALEVPLKATGTEEPPREPLEDPVHQAGDTKEDHGHILTQPQRLQKHEGAPDGPVEASPPGAAETV